MPQVSNGSFPALALLEYTGVPAGVVAADRMLKRAPVALIRAGSVQPGRWLVLLGGSTASVVEAHAEGLAAAGLHDELLLADAHAALAPALAGARSGAEAEALGLLEAASSAGLLGATDAALKACAVTLRELRLADGLGGKAFCVFDGALDEVEAAVAAGAARLGARLTQQAVIPRLDETLRALLAVGSRFAHCAPLEPPGAEPAVPVGGRADGEENY
jgi:microcompartment protein CcmL/EutN